VSVGDTACDEPLKGDVATAIQLSAQRVETDFDGVRGTWSRQAQLRQQVLDVRSEPGARRAVRESPTPLADQDLLHRTSDRAAAAQRLALGQGGLEPFDELAPTWRWESTQPGQIYRQADCFTGVGHAGRLTAPTQLATDPQRGQRDGPHGRFGRTAAFPNTLLPLGVANAGGISGARVEELEGVRHQRRHDLRGFSR
jgi:hypothetical protein